MVREITLELLEQHQRQVAAFATAEDALKEFKQQAFDIVITDVSLPAMSGLELARHILDLQPSVPIIVATGYALDLSQGTWGPKVRVILKPFDSQQIDALIADLCADLAPETTST